MPIGLRGNESAYAFLSILAAASDVGTMEWATTKTAIMIYFLTHLLCVRDTGVIAGFLQCPIPPLWSEQNCFFLSTATTDDTGCRPNVVRTVATRERCSESVIEMRAAMSRLVT